MARKTIQHLNSREMIAAQREEIAGLKVDREHLQFVVGRCVFEDEIAPECGRCQTKMRWGGEFAFCGGCLRTYRRIIVWQPVRIFEAEDD